MRSEDNRFATSALAPRAGVFLAVFAWTCLAGPAFAQQSLRTGLFATSFPEHSPLSATKVCVSRLFPPDKIDSALLETLMKDVPKTDDKEVAEHAFDSTKETWQVYVPEYYRENRKPQCGLFVYISPSDSGAPPPAWTSVLKKRHLLFVGADKSGNAHNSYSRRIPLALDAVHNLRKQYTIDPKRVYIAGTSGGACVASRMAIGFADVFAGGQYQVGIQHYQSFPVGDGAFTMGFPIVSEDLLRKAKSTGRYVLITGQTDHFREYMEKASQAMIRDGFRHVTYLEMPRVGHAAPNAAWFEKGIRALDSVPDEEESEEK